MPTASGPGPGSNGVSNNEACGIRDVWANNMEDEFKIIRQIVQKYNYIAMVRYFLKDISPVIISMEIIKILKAISPDI